MKTLAVVALGVLLASCEKSDPSGNGLTENQKKMATVVEDYVPKVVYDTYKALADETENLYQALNSASNQGVKALSQSDLDAICSSFLKARKYWEQSEAFLYGPATTFGIDPHIDTWPLDVEALATALSNADQIAMLKGEDGIAYAGAKLGQELLGFHGIEFIIFRDGKNRTVAALQAKEKDEAFAKYNVTGEQELIYATAVAGDLRDNCYRLYASWNPDAEKVYTDRMEEIEAERAPAITKAIEPEDSGEHTAHGFNWLWIVCGIAVLLALAFGVILIIVIRKRGDHEAKYYETEDTRYEDQN